MPRQVWHRASFDSEVRVASPDKPAHSFHPAWSIKVGLGLLKLRPVPGDGQRIDGPFFAVPVHCQPETVLEQSLQHDPALVVVELLKCGDIRVVQFRRNIVSLRVDPVASPPEILSFWKTRYAS